MPVVEATCERCGKALKPSSSRRHLSCAGCGTNRIADAPRSPAAEIAERVRRGGRGAAGDTDAARLQDELDRVERDWAAVESRYARGDADGKARYPSYAGAAFLGAFSGGIGLLLAFAGRVWAVPGAVPVGAAAVVLAAAFSTVEAVKAMSYHREKARHEARRAEIVSQVVERKLIEWQPGERRCEKNVSAAGERTTT